MEVQLNPCITVHRQGMLSFCSEVYTSTKMLVSRKQKLWFTVYHSQSHKLHVKRHKMHDVNVHFLISIILVEVAFLSPGFVWHYVGRHWSAGCILLVGCLEEVPKGLLDWGTNGSAVIARVFCEHCNWVLRRHDSAFAGSCERSNGFLVTPGSWPSPKWSVLQTHDDVFFVVPLAMISACSCVCQFHCQKQTSVKHEGHQQIKQIQTKHLTTNSLTTQIWHVDIVFKIWRCWILFLTMNTPVSTALAQRELWMGIFATTTFVTWQSDFAFEPMHQPLFKHTAWKLEICWIKLECSFDQMFVLNWSFADVAIGSILSILSIETRISCTITVQNWKLFWPQKLFSIHLFEFVNRQQTSHQVDSPMQPQWVGQHHKLNPQEFWSWLQQPSHPQSSAVPKSPSGQWQWEQDAHLFQCEGGCMWQRQSQKICWLQQRLQFTKKVCFPRSGFLSSDSEVSSSSSPLLLLSRRCCAQKSRASISQFSLALLSGMPSLFFIRTTSRQLGRLRGCSCSLLHCGLLLCFGLLWCDLSLCCNWSWCTSSALWCGLRLWCSSPCSLCSWCPIAIARKLKAKFWTLQLQSMVENACVLCVDASLESEDEGTIHTEWLHQTFVSWFVLCNFLWLMHSCFLSRSCSCTTSALWCDWWLKFMQWSSLMRNVHCFSHSPPRQCVTCINGSWLACSLRRGARDTRPVAWVTMKVECTDVIRFWAALLGMCFWAFRLTSKTIDMTFCLMQMRCTLCERVRNHHQKHSADQDAWLKGQGGFEGQIHRAAAVQSMCPHCWKDWTGLAARTISQVPCTQRNSTWPPQEVPRQRCTSVSPRECNQLSWTYGTTRSTGWIQRPTGAFLWRNECCQQWHWDTQCSTSHPCAPTKWQHQCPQNHWSQLWTFERRANKTRKDHRWFAGTTGWTVHCLWCVPDPGCRFHAKSRGLSVDNTGCCVQNFKISASVFANKNLFACNCLCFMQCTTMWGVAWHKEFAVNDVQTNNLLTWTSPPLMIVNFCSSHSSCFLCVCTRLRISELILQQPGSGSHLVWPLQPLQHQQIAPVRTEVSTGVTNNLRSPRMRWNVHEGWCGVRGSIITLNLDSTVITWMQMLTLHPPHWPQSQIQSPALCHTDSTANGDHTSCTCLSCNGQLFPRVVTSQGTHQQPVAPITRQLFLPEWQTTEMQSRLQPTPLACHNCQPPVNRLKSVKKFPTPPLSVSMNFAQGPWQCFSSLSTQTETVKKWQQLRWKIQENKARMQWTATTDLREPKSSNESIATVQLLSIPTETSPTWPIGFPPQRNVCRRANSSKLTTHQFDHPKRS